MKNEEDNSRLGTACAETLQGEGTGRETKTERRPVGPGAEKMGEVPGTGAEERGGGPVLQGLVGRPEFQLIL